MAKAKHVRLYEVLRTTDKDVVSSTCSRADIPTLRMGIARCGWRMRIAGGKGVVTFDAVRQ